MSAESGDLPLSLLVPWVDLNARFDLQKKRKEKNTVQPTTHYFVL